MTLRATRLEVIASNYFSKGMLINRESYVEANIIETKQINDLSFPITSDSDISTCVKATNEHQQLQGIFTSSARPPRNQLSVVLCIIWYILYYYTPRFNKVERGYIGFTLSVRPTVRLWRESCPLCIFNSSGPCHISHLINQLPKVCHV